MARLLLAFALSVPFLPAAGAPSGAELIERSCLRCHNAAARMGGLSLATAADARKGGAHGPALVPGDPAKSLLIGMISGERPRMPAGGPPLSAREVETIREWIGQGAPWGGAGATWWSLRPLRIPAVPERRDGARNAIDAFVRARLAEKGLAPSPEADRPTLIRRLTYDLHGLPPAWDEIRAFVEDRSPDAYERLVDRLLASPRYGERWGRHWLDAVHYGESHGYDKDKPRRNAWPYRDWVIRSFNRDKPYARFVEEQIAGDVLYPDDPEGVEATGFLAAGPWDFVGHVELREGTTDKTITRLLDRDDMVMTAMSAFVSMTAHCARCHDHKFDPIPQADYYALQAVFAGVDRSDRPYDSDPRVHARRRELLEARRALSAKLRPLTEAAAAVQSPELEKINAELSELKFEFAETKKAELQPRIAELTLARKSLMEALAGDELKRETARLTGEMRALDGEIAKLPKPRWVYAAANYFEPQGTFTFAVEPRPVAVLARGSVESPGAPAVPGALSCVSALGSRFAVEQGAPEGERRAALARWITHRENMLAWRSIVNRVWQHHFGTGIVETANDFGRMGAEPTHPEMLDWLATTFRDGGGSLKRLHKLILMSATWRQSSAHDPERARIDAENRYLWRMNRQRLDAESIRDAVLLLSGKLDLTMGGPSAEHFVFKDDHSPVYDYARFDVDNPAGYRRGVYRFIVRSAGDPWMDRLDCPDPSLLTARRNTTITAIQALALLNHPFMTRQAEHFAERVRGLSGTAAEQVAWIGRLALGRDFTAAEAARLSAHAARHGLENACRAVLNSNEFLFVE